MSRERERQELLDRMADQLDERLGGMTSAQLEAITHPGGPAAVLACPGAGKTRVLTFRICWLLAEVGVGGDEVTALTFTNKAAQEMRDRVRLFADDVADELILATFHSLAVRILRRAGDDIEEFGWRKGFVIYSAGEIADLSLRVLRDNATVGTEGESIDDILRWIETCKRKLLWPEHVDPADEPHPGWLDFYRSYQGRLRSSNAMDFSDLLVGAVRMLAWHEGVRAYWQRRCRYLLVDEFQDTNEAQYNFLLQLVGPDSESCFIVGDEDQSIYGFRGAQPAIMARFVEDLGAEVLRLEDSFRSTQSILTAAEGLIDHNTDRLGKRMKSRRKEDEPVRIIEAASWRDAVSITHRVLTREHDLGVPWRDMAIILRTRRQVTMFHASLSGMEGVPSAPSGHRDFFERAEIRDALAWLRLLINRRDDAAFLRVCNRPRRGFGEGSKRKLLERSLGTEQSVEEVCREALRAEEGFFRSARRAVRDFIFLLDGLRSLPDRLGAGDVLRDVLTRTKYAITIADDAEKQQNLALLLRQLSKLEGPWRSALATYFEDVALGDLDDSETRPDRVSLLTAHSSKGLEFPVVMLCPLMEGGFPLLRDPGLGDRLRRAVEEERRLTYVAMTRAGDRLFLLAPAESHDGEKMQRSRFFKEIPREVLKRAAERDSPDDLKLKRWARKYVRHRSFGVGRVQVTDRRAGRAIFQVHFPDGDRVVLAKDCTDVTERVMRQKALKAQEDQEADER